MLNEPYQRHFANRRLRLLLALSIRSLEILEHLSVVDAVWDEGCYDSQCFYAVYAFEFSCAGKTYPFLGIDSDHDCLDFFSGNLNQDQFYELFENTVHSPEGLVIRSFLEEMEWFHCIAKNGKRDPSLTAEWKDLIVFYSHSEYGLTSMSGY